MQQESGNADDDYFHRKRHCAAERCGKATNEKRLRGSPMPALLIADILVKDAEAYTEYRNANPAIVNSFGGRYIALGGETEVLEGDWQPRRTIVIEFPDMDAIRAFYNSPEYVELRKIRWRNADSRLVAIETLPKPVDRP
jgi:uncharacterized protein (DUF1330 family)